MTVLDEFPSTFPEVFGTVVGDTTGVPAVTVASVGGGAVTVATVGED